MQSAFLHIGRKFKPKRLLDSVALVIMALVVVQMVALGAIFSRIIFEIVEQQTGKRALQAAKYVALIPELKKVVEQGDEFGALHTLAESIRLEAEATRIVITNRDAIQLFNTDPKQIGTRYLPPTESRALRHGRPYISKRVGAIISGNAPIFNSELDIIGMVSVGYPVANVHQLTQGYLEKELFYLWLFITLGLAAAILIAQGVKRATLGLEPQEIANLFEEREAIIASIREGLIATDAQGTITLLNQAARDQLGEEPLHQPIKKIFPQLDISPVFTSGEQILNLEISFLGTEMIFNMVPIQHATVFHGAVATFRRKDEIDLMARELSQVQTYSDMLRAQTHEYSNRLHAIVGMVQMEEYDEMLDFIAEETTGHRLLIRQLTETIPDPILSSFLIGKYMHAQELKVDFSIDSESHMVNIPDQLNRHRLVTILGNLLNNAFDAALTNKTNPQVKIFMTDFGNDLIFEIEDSGSGVPKNIQETIFEKGVTTKTGEKRGYGLHLVKNSLMSMNGGVSVQCGGLGGALFVVEIPKGKVVL